MKQRIKIKPLSVNEAYTGRRFKTQLYKDFAKHFGYRLKHIDVPFNKIEINYKFGFSNSGSDVDNCLKVSQDLIAKKFRFNDKLIYKITSEKEIVENGNEYIEFEIFDYEAKTPIEVLIGQYEVNLNNVFEQLGSGITDIIEKSKLEAMASCYRRILLQLMTI